MILSVMMTVAPYFTAKMCQKEGVEQVAIGEFFYLNVWICLGFSLLFGRCESKTEAVISRLNERYYLKSVGRMLFFITTITSILLVILSWARDYNHQIRLILFDQFVIEGLSLQFFYLISLWFGLGCLYLTYCLLIPLYSE